MNELKVDFSDFKKVLDALLVKINDNERKLTIWQEMDCYILEGKIEDITRKWVIEIDPNDPLEACIRLIFELMNYFSFSGSKHDEERIRVTRVKRDD